MRYDIKPVLTDKEAEALAGTMLSKDSYNLLIKEDADIYCQETGRCIAKFRKKVIPLSVAKAAFENLKGAATKFDNRGLAGGWDEEKVKEVVERESGKGFVREEGSVRFKLITKDGTVSKTNRAVPTESGIIGYFDRNPRFPYCRQTAFNEKQFNKFKKAYPIIKVVDKHYSELMPEHYKLQRNEADNSSQDFVIKNTAFSTVTVNKNWQTAVHTDKGDFERGFGNLVVLRKGIYEGGFFVLPKWAVAFDLQNQDILLVDVHQWHGNTHIKKLTKDAVRLSLVMYYRKNIIKCLDAEEELKRAQTRVAGDPINE